MERFEQQEYEVIVVAGPQALTTEEVTAALAAAFPGHKVLLRELPGAIYRPGEALPPRSVLRERERAQLEQRRRDRAAFDAEHGTGESTQDVAKC